MLEPTSHPSPHEKGPSHYLSPLRSRFPCYFPFLCKLSQFLENSLAPYSARKYLAIPVYWCRFPQQVLQSNRDGDNALWEKLVLPSKIMLVVPYAQDDRWRWPLSPPLQICPYRLCSCRLWHILSLLASQHAIRGLLTLVSWSQSLTSLCPHPWFILICGVKPCRWFELYFIVDLSTLYAYPRKLFIFESNP